ncbi:hypothetical protein GCM10009612_13930 [Streptomyces beijiangensis]
MNPDLEDACEDCGAPAGGYCYANCRGPAYTPDLARRLTEIRRDRANPTRSSS